MLQDLHAPAPSPIFIATGTRQLPEQDLKVNVHDTRGRLELKTQSLQITIDRAAATLTMLNPETPASWVFSFAEQAAATPTPVPAAAVPPTFTHLTRQQNTWSFSFPTPAGDATVTLELLHAGMATLSIARPAPGPLTIHIAGADPCFGLGERFYQAALSDTHFDVRPADRSGEPGHNWSYVAIPLVYPPTGLGLYADTVFDTNFNFNPAGSAFDLRVANPPVTFYFLSGAGPKSILEQYTALTGRPESP